MARKKKEVVPATVPVETLVVEKPKTEKKRKKHGKVFLPVPEVLRVKNPQVSIEDNQFFLDDSRSGIKISRSEKLEEALAESKQHVIYVSPALISVTNATILTGKDAELWKRYWTVRMRWVRVTERVKRFFRHLTRLKNQ